MATRDAAVERLTKLITEPQPGDGDSQEKRGLRRRRPTVHIHVGLAEGWFSLFLLATVVYSTIWCVQAAGWVNNLGILTLTTALGLLIGVIAAKQRRIPRLLTHLIVIVLGILLAFWQTAGADYAGNTGALFNGMYQWVLLAVSGGTSNNDSIFLFFITALSFILAYTSAWLVYRTRSPWLMIAANVVVLLINLSNIEDGYVVFLVVFLIASLLLLLRFNLYESSQRWKRLRLRCADDLGWDFMQAGALISIGILIFSWLLPWGYTNDAAAQIWSASNNPWVILQNDWNRLISVSGGFTPSNHGNFAATLVLGGNPNLNNDVVLTVKTPDGSQYLEALSYDNYTGRSWLISPTDSTSYKTNQESTSESILSHLLQQHITVVNPPGEQYAFILGAPQIASVDQSAEVLTNKTTSSVVAFLRKNGNLAAGDSYSVTSFVSSADVQTLRSVPLPADQSSFANFEGENLALSYDQNLLRTYMQLPGGLDPNILLLAKQIVANAHAHTMYDMAVALENYLRSNYSYDANISPPAGQELVSWFLFRSGHKGYCTYFATSMAIMARLLGMPARVVSGYTNGTYDPKNNQWVIRGTDAHTWTQIYFAGYGWINFEPSASFSTFSRPLPNQFGSSTTTPTNPGSQGNTSVSGKHTNPTLPDESNGSTTGTGTSTGAQLRQQIGLTLGSLVLLILFGLILFGIWWRRLFRGYSIAAQIYGRICVLANWAGISLSRSQTPYEYIHALSQVAPDEAMTLERLGDIYVRDVWADPASREHPRRTGEVNELPDLWKGLQPHLFLYVLRHPYFLRRLPARIGSFINSRRRRRSRLLDEDI